MAAASLPAALPAGLQAVVRASAASPFEPAALCQAVDALPQPVLRQSLCTVNRLEPVQLRLTRIYSSNPAAYPPGGSKDKRGTAWGRQVLLDLRPFVGEGPDAIRAAFDDHEAIARLHLRSVVNVPVVFEQRCLGTLNLLMQSDSVDPGQLEFAQLLAMLLLPALMP